MEIANMWTEALFGRILEGQETGMPFLRSSDSTLVIHREPLLSLVPRGATLAHRHPSKRGSVSF